MSGNQIQLVLHRTTNFLKNLIPSQRHSDRQGPKDRLKMDLIVWIHFSLNILFPQELNLCLNQLLVAKLLHLQPTL